MSHVVCPMYDCRAIAMSSGGTAQPWHMPGRLNSLKVVHWCFEVVFTAKKQLNLLWVGL